ncbi:MAG TPA: hypothetical protein VF240_18920 [Pyrinomonadaceae bacterium]
MRHSASTPMLALALCAAASVAAFAQGPARRSESPLTNFSVVKLVRAGFREKTVIAIIRTRPARFDLSPDRLIDLKKNGVSEKIILAMIGHDLDTTLVAAEDDWGSDDSFFKQGMPGGKGGASDPGETNIFGSSGGSRGSVRQNGVGGGSEGETLTTGSATVRIIRPPAEGGAAAAPKLERTPTLTNDSVVELVEAGFSEGTIVRRIEQSPAEFDLAPEKLSELRKRRVSEPVIAAMRSAMSDDAAPARPEN